MQLSLETIKDNIASFKEKTIKLAFDAVSHPDARYLEPKELKTLTDVVLNIEDSYKHTVDEGETARKIDRLLAKYSSEDASDIIVNTGILIEANHHDDY